MLYIVPSKWPKAGASIKKARKNFTVLNEKTNFVPLITGNKENKVYHITEMANQANNNTFNANDALNRSEAFLIKQKNKIIIAVAAIIVIIAGVLLYNRFVLQPREEKAATLMAKGQEYFAGGDFQKAINGDGAGFPGFLSIAKQYSSTKSGNLANLYVGISFAHMDKPQDALKYLEEYDTAGDAMIEAEAIGAMGDCYAALNQPDKAVEYFKKAAATADNNSLSPVFLVKAGEVLEAQKKYDEAISIYQQVKDEYVQSAIQQEIDKYIERATVSK